MSPHQEVRFQSGLPTAGRASTPPLTSLSSPSHSLQSAPVGGLLPQRTTAAIWTDSSTPNYPQVPRRASEEWARWTLSCTHISSLQTGLWKARLLDEFKIALQRFNFRTTVVILSFSIEFLIMQATSRYIAFMLAWLVINSTEITSLDGKQMFPKKSKWFELP